VLPALEVPVVVLEVVERLAGGLELVQPMDEVVALDVRDLEVDAGLGEDLGRLLRQALGVEGARVRQDLGPVRLDRRKRELEVREEARLVAQVGVLAELERAPREVLVSVTADRMRSLTISAR
jgi:hypothetical protein